MADEVFSPQDWFKRARSNLILGTAFDFEHLPEDIYLEDLCFELQQAGEKALKAVLIKSC